MTLYATPKIASPVPQLVTPPWSSCFRGLKDSCFTFCDISFKFDETKHTDWINTKFIIATEHFVFSCIPQIPKCFAEQ